MHSPKCPKCGSNMEKIKGKYGYFWGCQQFRKKGCKGTINIPLIPFEFQYIDYDGFVENNPTKYLLDLIEREDFPKYVKQLKYELNGRPIKKGTIYEDDIKGKISGIFDYLSKNKKNFIIAKLAYWFYVLDGNLQGKMDFWLNRKPLNEYRKEYHVKKAFIENWYLNPLGLRGFNFYNEEHHIGESKGYFGGYIIDVVAKDTLGKSVFLEVKGFNTKGPKAMEQLLTYVRFYNKINPPDKKINKAYIICKGYPRGVFDGDLDIDIGVIGYIIEDNSISFIPWKMI